jgi:hypothetical protein
MQLELRQIFARQHRQQLIAGVVHGALLCRKGGSTMGSQPLAPEGSLPAMRRM